MFKTWDIEASAGLTIDDLISTIEKRGPAPLSGYNLDKTADLMSAVYRNRSSVFDTVIRKFDSLLNPDDNDYGPDSIVLHKGEHFYVRLVIWLPNLFKGVTSHLTTDVIHDHNFNFMTLGLMGTGYITEIWQHRNEPAVGLQPGHAVPVRRDGEHTLAEGRIFYFKKNIDIHRQLPPATFSVSLNIIETTGITDRQYEFHPPASTKAGELKVSRPLNILVADLLEARTGGTDFLRRQAALAEAAL